MLFKLLKNIKKIKQNDKKYHTKKGKDVITLDHTKGTKGDQKNEIHFNR